MKGNSEENENIESQSICPYCKKILEQTPKQKKRCPSCSNFIFVRTLPLTHQKVLVTEDEAKKIDKEWDKVSSRKNAILQLSSYGISENEFDNYKKNFKFEVSDSDVIWSLLNNLLQKNMKENNLGNLSSIYSHMALILSKAGKDCFEYSQQARKMELLRYQHLRSEIIIGVKILTMGCNSCEACQKLDGQVFTIEEALEKMPIPCKECTNMLFNDKYPFCRCGYITVLKKII